MLPRGIHQDTIKTVTFLKVKERNSRLKIAGYKMARVLAYIAK